MTRWNFSAANSFAIPSRSAKSSLTNLKLAWRLQDREPRMLQRDVVVLVEVVEPDDLDRRARAAFDVWKPMNPAAPVTSIFKRCSLALRSEAAVGLVLRQHVLDVEDYDVRTAEGANALRSRARRIPDAPPRRRWRRSCRASARDHRDAVLVLAPRADSPTGRTRRLCSRSSCSSFTTSATFVLRTSGQFSLNVSPSTSTRAPDGWMFRLIMSLITRHATYSAMLSFSRRPARIISGR